MTYMCLSPLDYTSENSTFNMAYLGLTGNGLLAGIALSSGMGFVLFGGSLSFSSQKAHGSY